MKILYYSSHPNVNMAAPSGPGTHIREVIRGFEDRGHTVIKLIAGGESLATGASEITFRKRSYRRFIPSYIWHTLKDVQLLRHDEACYRKLIDLIEREKPDLIYERTYYLTSSGYRAAKKMGVKYFCEVNAPYPQEKLQMEGKSFFYSRAIKNEAAQMAAADRIFTVSGAMKEYLLRSSPGITQKIIITPNAVNAALIHVDDQLTSQIRKLLGYAPADVVTGFVGSIFPYHGVDLLVDTFHTLIKKQGRTGLKLLIVGDGETLPGLRLRVNELGIGAHVLFTGNIPHSQVWSYISVMDIAVMARSNWYGSPVKIFEYGAMKKAIIAPDVLPVKDVMKHGEHGMLTADNEAALLANLAYMLDDEVERNRMATAFYNKVLSQHTWQHVVDTILKEAE